MTAEFKKGSITIPNRLYGDRIVSAYLKDGIAIAKVGKGWGVFHAPSGTEVYFKLQRRTLREAQAVADRILLLDVDWTKEIGDRIFEEQFRLAPTAIREIASGESE